MKYSDCEICGKWSPRLAFIGNVAASIFKFVVGMTTGSKGLVADSVHSVADAMSSLFILIALRISGKPKDKNHPFGHGKVEYISTIFASLFIFVCATTIFLDALNSFKNGTHEVPGNAAILATILCLFYSFLMYNSNKCSGTQLNSPALLADAAECKADSLASVAVLLGLVGAKLGFIYSDTIAAGAVSLLVFHISVEMFLQGTNGLIDVSIDKNVLDRIKELCLNTKGIEGVRSMRSRSMGPKNKVDIALDISKTKTVLEAHQLTEKLKEKIAETIDDIDDVFIRTYPIHSWRPWKG
jgi:cation diffusion facilitator family transporter